MKSSSTTKAAIKDLEKKITIKVIGIGGGGCNAIAHRRSDGLDGVPFIALNTDAQALARTSVEESLVLGASLTRGLGTGGDPEMGRNAAEVDADKLKELCAGADIIFVLAGLGGGTGTGGAPVLARIARESGALVLGIVTLPFDFEGARRQRQAQHGLQELKASADAVICLPNQSIFKLIDENTSMLEAFKISNELLMQGVLGIWRLLTQSGLINVDFNDLCSVTRGRHAESAFACVEATGDNRAQQALEQLLTHPLLESGQVLGDADTVLVSIVGGKDLGMGEVNRLMEQINRHCENAHMIMGAAIDEKYSNRLAVTLVASRRATETPEPAAPQRRMQIPGDRAAGEKALSAADFDTEMINRSATARPASRFVAPPPELTDARAEQMLGKQGRRRKSKPMRQGQLPLEIISKGRFEKSEPTIHHGEDLDVPTYIRRGVALN